MSAEKEKTSENTPKGVKNRRFEYGFVTETGYDFDAIEKALSSDVVGFGNPHSKLSQHEQFLLWKQMIQQGQIQSRDVFCNIMAQCSSFEQGQQRIQSLMNQAQ